MRLSKKCLCGLFSVPLFLTTVLCLSQEFSVGALDYVMYDNTGGVSESPYGEAQIPCEYSDIDYLLEKEFPNLRVLIMIF